MFRILGEVDAHIDGRRVDVGHARQRCVLVCLLVDVNRPVSTDQLIDRVWAGAPPHKARNALAAYVSRLRRLLTDADDAQIVRGPDGYALRAAAHSVDLHLFRHHVSQARKASSPTDAARLFDRALSMWRGQPFAAVDTPWANEVRLALESERFSMTLDRNDAALGLGRHAELLGELAVTLQTHPLDERVAGQLMLAQYRSGRQAEALDTYRVTRDRLVDELGVDPSPALETVYKQILDGDPARPAPPSAPHPVELRRQPTRLIGREQNIQQVLAALDDGPAVTLTGVGGVGKTRLALATADRLRETFADGAVVCELAQLDGAGGVLQAVGAGLRLQPGQDLGYASAVIDFLRHRELLLVLDNCEHVLHEAADLVDRIGRQCLRVKVLATSREPLAVAGERLLPVQPLPADHAAELFVERARASRPDFDLAQQPVGAVADICRQLDGVPLAIELAAARMRAMSTADLAGRLDRLRLLTGGVRGVHPRQQSVAATIDWSYRLLTENEQELFAQLSLFAGGFDAEAAHAVCGAAGTAEDDTVDLLTGLVDKSMVTLASSRGPTRYRVLETLRSYGRKVLQNKGLYDTMAIRHARYYTDLIERAAAGIQGADEKVWIERLMPEPVSYTFPDYDNLRTAFERAIETGDLDLALRLVTALPELMYMRIGVHCGEWAQQAVELADPAHPLFDAAVGAAARAAWYVGHYPHARTLADLARGCAGSLPIGFCARSADVRADTALYEGDPQACLAHYAEQLVPAREASDPRRLVWILYNITICHAAMHAPADGLTAAQEAIQVAAAVVNPTTQAMAQCALGRALAEAEPHRAIALFDRARDLAESVTNNWLIGIACAEDAAIRAVHGDPADTARIFLEIVDHWEFGGPGIVSYQWDTLRSATQLLLRLDAAAEALTLHRTLVDAGREPPLSALQVAGLGAVADAAVLNGADAVALARTTLRRYL